jgi:hypothetical protein
MATSSQVQYAGEINLEYLRIFSSEGVRADLSSIVVEINLFESIFSTAFTGNIIIVDTLNLIEKLPILGQEYIELKCSTPQENPTKESVIEKRFVLHSIVAREDISTGAQAYSLDIATEDSLINLKTRVSKSYTNTINNIVSDVLAIKLGSPQDLNIEPTLGIRRIVSPNVHPYTLINMLKKEAVSTLSNNASLPPHFLFFENKNGFNFVSLQSLYNNGIVARLHSGDKESDESLGREAYHKDDTKIAQSNKRILSYSFGANNDLSSNITNGMMGSNLTTHDIYNKSYQNYNYDYFRDFNKHDRTETHGKPIYNESSGPQKYLMSEFTNSSIKVHPTCGLETDKQHYGDGDLRANKPQDWILDRQAKMFELTNGGTINISMNGNTNMTVGDMVHIYIPVTGVDHDDEEVESTSGNYLITKLRHAISPQQKQHEIHMQLVRDCTTKSYKQMEG